MNNLKLYALADTEENVIGVWLSSAKQRSEVYEAAFKAPYTPEELVDPPPPGWRVHEYSAAPFDLAYEAFWGIVARAELEVVFDLDGMIRVWFDPQEVY